MHLIIEQANYIEGICHDSKLILLSMAKGIQVSCNPMCGILSTMAMPTIQIPNNIIVDHSGSKTIFATEKANAIIQLTGSIQQSRLAKNQWAPGVLHPEAARAEDTIHLSA